MVKINGSGNGNQILNVKLVLVKIRLIKLAKMGLVDLSEFDISR